jgi:DNA-binding response OmpR family regulator
VVALTPAGRPIPGADACIDRPVRMAELMAAIKHLVEQARESPVAVGDFLFKRRAKILLARRGHAVVRLTEKEAAILDRLYGAAGAAVAREDLLTDVWGYDERVLTHTLETHIYRLRQKIEPKSGAQVLVVTEPGGYRLVADTAA